MQSTLQPLVSVVTPVYNGEAYLSECIESVLCQTYQNWEYSIVNNCSKDLTLKIANCYAKKDSRIHVYDNEEFLSVTQNCNRAFCQISPESKYCKVVHADDWLFPECIQKMVKVAESNTSVGLVGSYALQGERVICHGLPYQSKFVPGRELARLALLRRVYPFYPSSLLIRSDLIRKRKCFYNEPHLYADVEACYEVLRDYDFAFVHQVLAFIRKHDQSQTLSTAAPLNKIILNNLILLTKYGPLYLDSEEYEALLEERIYEYYQFLAHSLFQLRGKEFWKYHKNGIQQIGYQFSIWKLLMASLRELTRSTRNAVGTSISSLRGKLEKDKSKI